MINVLPHPLFQRDGTDLHVEVPITFVQAALGAEIEVPTLEGKETLTIPEGTQSGKVLRKGSEIDAYRLELLRRLPDGWRNPDRRSEAGISRESVYVGWFSERLTNVADLDGSACRLASFRRSRALRGRQRGPEGPDAILHGECIVRDPVGFAARLRTGVGRHRAYGYGMLIVRPPGTAPRSS